MCQVVSIYLKCNPKFYQYFSQCSRQDRDMGFGGRGRGRGRGGPPGPGRGGFIPRGRGRGGGFGDHGGQWGKAKYKDQFILRLK